MRRVITRPLFLEDLDTIVAHIEEDSPEAADRFLETAKSALQYLSEMPALGAPRRFPNPRLGLLRFWPLRGFDRYIVFYRVSDETVEFLRVLHSARDVPRILSEDFGPEP